jgi:hypothetical protein
MVKPGIFYQDTCIMPLNASISANPIPKNFDQLVGLFSDNKNSRLTNFFITLWNSLPSISCRRSAHQNRNVHNTKKMNKAILFDEIKGFHLQSKTDQFREYIDKTSMKYFGSRIFSDPKNYALKREQARYKARDLLADSYFNGNKSAANVVFLNANLSIGSAAYRNQISLHDNLLNKNLLVKNLSELQEYAKISLKINSRPPSKIPAPDNNQSAANGAASVNNLKHKNNNDYSSYEPSISWGFSGRSRSDSTSISGYGGPLYNNVFDSKSASHSLQFDDDIQIVSKNNKNFQV